jgi:hypothetical protein
MNAPKWAIFSVALGMIAATAGYLGEVVHFHRLGQPGVRVGPVPLYGEDGRQVTTESVLLPETVLGGSASNAPITEPELNFLPKDTTFGRRIYTAPDGRQTMIGVVLMGSDRTSIHDPHFCLVGSGWVIDKTEHVTLHMDSPYPYEMPAIKLTTSMLTVDSQKRAVMVGGVYVYWFVTAEKITADQGARLFSIAETMVKTGVLERWAYVTYFSTCPPGEENATFERMERFIRASAPSFQTVTGRPEGASPPVAARR